MGLNELKESILHFANKYKKLEAYQALFDNHPSYPKLVEMIIIDMFEHNFDYRSCDDLSYEYYNIIHTYLVHLRKCGYYEFDKN